MKISHLERENLELQKQLASLQQLLQGMPLEVDSNSKRQSPVMIYRLQRNAAGQMAFLFISESCYEILNLTAQQVMADANLFCERIHPEDQGQVLEALERSIQTTQRCCCQCRILDSQGKPKTLQTVFVSTKDVDDATVVWNGLLTEVPPSQADQRKSLAPEQNSQVEPSRISTLMAEKDALRRLLILQDRDRKQISHDIHDGFIQYAVAAHMHLESMVLRMKQSQLQAPLELDRVRDLVDQAIADARRMIGEVRPSLIAECGITGAIQQLVDEESRKGLDVRSRLSIDREDYDAELGQVVFRIVQEALANVRRHAQVKQAFLRITESAEKLKVIVRDQGVGFAFDDVADDRFGLEGIRERAELYDGHAKIRSRPGRGTLLIVELPLNRTTRAFVAQ